MKHKRHLVPSWTGIYLKQKLLWAFVALRAQKQSLITAEMLLEKAEVGTAVLKKVIDYGVLEVYTEAVDRVSFASDSDTLALSPAQEKALQEIEVSFAEKNTSLKGSRCFTYCLK